MNFPNEFEKWLDKALNKKIPREVQAFSFNLHKPAGIDGVKFGIEIIGASRFDKDDPDWPCDEIWEPKKRDINIPISFSTENWEQCLEKIKLLINTILINESKVSKILKSKSGVGVGFVDGDLDVIWQP